MAIEQTKAYKTLRKSLLDSLEARGLVEEVYRDKVEEYMTLWRQLRELQEDIRERGGEPERISGHPGVQTDAGNLHRSRAEAGGKLWAAVWS